MERVLDFIQLGGLRLTGKPSACYSAKVNRSVKVLDFVKSGGLAGDRTTRYPLDYIPGQLPPSPTVHEYLSFPSLLCLSNEGS